MHIRFGDGISVVWCGVYFHSQGESRFRLEITVANSQPLPLKFKNFKVSLLVSIVGAKLEWKKAQKIA
jgi:hypothetical protein